MRFGKQVIFAVALALLAAAPLSAQTATSRLTGTVKDAQGAVLPGVTVTATSPALIGSQIAVTEANGSYQFPSLPSGTYNVKFELSGFKAFSRQNITLALGQTLSVDATLQLASLQETVQVTAESPIVDTQSTAVGNTMDTSKLIGVPASSDMWGALAQAPGVRMQGFDVGGSHKSQQSGYEAFGISGQARVIIEGVDVTEGTGGAGGYWDYYSQNEVSVAAAGQDVEMNTPGAATIATIKSGGNQFKSLYNQSYEPGGFVGNNVDSSITDRGGSAAKNQLFWESHIDVGGPIVKDRLWFFTAYNHFKIDKAISGVPISTATDLMINDTFVAKSTWKVTSKDTLVGYYQWQRKQKPTRGLSATRPLESTLAQFSPGWQYNGKWQRVWSNRLFTELNIGEFGYIFPEQPSVDYKTNPPRTDLVTGVDSGAGFTGGNHRPLLARARQAAGLRQGDLLPADAERRQPRPEGRLRVDQRHVELREQRHVGPAPLSRLQRRDLGDPVDRPGRPGEAGQHVDDSGRRQQAAGDLRPGPLDGHQQGDDHGRRAVRPAAAVLHRGQA